MPKEENLESPVVLWIMEDCNNRPFQFNSKNDALRLIDLIYAYQLAHRGNGYGAYWIEDEAQWADPQQIERSELRTHLHTPMLNSMVDRIKSAFQSDGPPTHISFTTSSEEEGIAFDIQGLPPPDQIPDPLELLSKATVKAATAP